MKTNFLKTLLIALLPIVAVSCIPNVPEEEVLPRDAVSFESYIDQNAEPKYYLDFYVDSDITFKNTSPETTIGEPTWDFGDGTTSNEQNPIHTYQKDGVHYTVTLTVSGPEGESKCCKVWEVLVYDKNNPIGQYD